MADPVAVVYRYDADTIRWTEAQLDAAWALHREASPRWIAVNDFDGHNWLVGDFGEEEDQHGKQQHWYLTTDHVRTSEMNGGPESDAHFCAFARHALPSAVQQLRLAHAVAEHARIFLAWHGEPPPASLEHRVHQQLVETLAEWDESLKPVVEEDPNQTTLDLGAFGIKSEIDFAAFTAKEET